MRLRDVTSSEKISEIKSLLKEDLDIDNVKVDNTYDDETTTRNKNCFVIWALCSFHQNTFLYQMTAEK